MSIMGQPKGIIGPTKTKLGHYSLMQGIRIRFEDEHLTRRLTCTIGYHTQQMGMSLLTKNFTANGQT